MKGFEVEDLSVAYGASPVLWDIDITIAPGVLHGIVGPNGAGKSTLIKAALNLVPTLSGAVRFEGKSYKNMYKSIGYVPQKESVDWDFPTTVYDAVLMGRYGHIGWVRRVRKQDKTKALEALEQVGMSDYMHRQISELSGGQRQRVFLARALVQEAQIYFMDEPFQGVDVRTEKAIVNVLQTLKQQGKTVIVVHHDLNTVQAYFDTLTLLNVRVVAHGAVEDVYTEENIQKTYMSNASLLGESGDV